MTDGSHARPPRTSLLRWGAPLGMALLFFLTIAPTLTWLEFSNGSENLNVATVLDTHREGRWLVPSLQGEVRTQKPPLTAWVTGVAVRQSTYEGMSSREEAVRERAARRLAWDVRWTALASSCALVMAVYGLGRVLGGEQIGLFAPLACGSSLLFLRQARLSTTDVQLALWVTVANYFLAKAILQGRWWTGLTLGGVAIGLAMMSKGPVALVQTVMPAAAFVAWRVWGTRGQAQPTSRPPIMAILASVLLMLVVGFSWFVYVLLSSGSASSLWARWMSEVTREGATSLAASPWYNYTLIVPLMFPWVVFLVVGLILAIQSTARRVDEPMLFGSALLIIPLLVMSFFRDREQRYLLPMVGPAAILVAWGLREHLRSWPRRTRNDLIGVTIHWIALAVVAIGLPIAGALGIDEMRTVDGRPWFTPAFAAVAAFVAALLIGAGVLLHRRRDDALVATTVAVMLVLQVVALHGYRDAPNGRSHMKSLAAAIWEAEPDAVVWSGVQNRRTPTDLSIYLDRTIITHPDPAAIAPTGRPQVLLLYQRRRTPEPVPPPGWSFLAKGERDGNTWWAFVMP